MTENLRQALNSITQPTIEGIVHNAVVDFYWELEEKLRKETGIGIGALGVQELFDAMNMNAFKESVCATFKELRAQAMKESREL